MGAAEHPPEMSRMREIELDRESWALDLLETVEQENEELRTRLEALEVRNTYLMGEAEGMKFLAEQHEKNAEEAERWARVWRGRAEEAGWEDKTLAGLTKALKDVYTDQNRQFYAGKEAKFPIFKNGKIETKSVPTKGYPSGHGKNKRAGHRRGR